MTELQKKVAEAVIRSCSAFKNEFNSPFGCEDLAALAGVELSLGADDPAPGAHGLFQFRRPALEDAYEWLIASHRSFWKSLPDRIKLTPQEFMRVVKTLERLDSQVIYALAYSERYQHAWDFDAANLTQAERAALWWLYGGCAKRSYSPDFELFYKRLKSCLGMDVEHPQSRLERFRAYRSEMFFQE